MPVRRAAARRLRSGAFAAAALLVAAVAHGGTVAAAFSVQISLVRPDAPRQWSTSGNTSYCVSSSLTQQTRAQVQVVCSTGEFVSIEPLLNQEFVPTHGGAFRFSLGGRVGELASWSMTRDRGETVTAVELFELVENAEVIEMLVSF